MEQLKYFIGVMSLVMMMATGAQGQTTWPIGIPTPSFGIQEVSPPDPSPWTSPVAGFYFVCPTCSGATDTGRALGTPSQPRASIPSPIPAGSVVRLKGRVDNFINILAAGTQSQPVFFRGIPTDQPLLTREIETKGSSYLIIEQVVFGNRGDGTAGRLVIPGYSGTSAHHVVVRNSEFTGNQNKAGGLYVLGGTQHVVYQNRLHDMGNLSDTGDQDSHCVTMGGTASEVWLVENELARCSGDGLQINAGTNNNNAAHHLYIGRNFAHHNKQTGVWSKNASDVIISQNRFEDTQPSSSSTGACSGAQYGPQRVWWLFNTFERCTWGISIQSTSGLGDGTHAYMIGNQMIGSMQRGISLWPDSVRSVSVVNNTMNSPIYIETRNAAHTVENNVSSGPVYWGNGQGGSTMRANVTVGQPTLDTGVVAAAYAEFQSRYGRSIAYDIDGQSRPQGAGWDIGARESAGQTVPPTNCVGTWTETLSEPVPLVCDASQVQSRTRTRTFVVTTPEANGGSCVERSQSPIVSVETSPCVFVPPPPPVPSLTIFTAVKTCRVTIQSQPPDQSGGWGIQFRWNQSNFGSRDASSPYERARDFPAGTYQLSGVWSKADQIVALPAIPYVCQ